MPSPEIWVPGCQNYGLRGQSDTHDPMGRDTGRPDLPMSVRCAFVYLFTRLYVANVGVDQFILCRSCRARQTLTRCCCQGATVRGVWDRRVMLLGNRQLRCASPVA